MKENWFYVEVWATLVAATLLEVFTRSIPAAAYVIILGIITISIIKALVIASFYQRLRYEAKALLILPGAALIALTLLILTLMSMGAM